MSAAHAAPLAVLASSKNGLRSSALSICCGVCCPRALSSREKIEAEKSGRPQEAEPLWAGEPSRAARQGLTFVASLRLTGYFLAAPASCRAARQRYMTQAGDDPRLKEAFELFDKDGDGLISHEELATVMRSLGHNPTQQEMRDLISEGTSGQFTARNGMITFELFCKLMRRKVRDDDTEAEMKDAFRVLDKVGQGWIGVDEMRRICKHLGEDLTEDEVRDMISEAISNFEGKVYYDGFVKTMIMKP